VSDNLAIEVYRDGEWQPAENLELHLGPAVHELPDGAETINAQIPHSEPWGLRNAEGKVIRSSPGAPE
jgi:hypothetical protein